MDNAARSASPQVNSAPGVDRAPFELFLIQEAKLKLARAGADYFVFRGGKASVGQMVLGSEELRDLRRRVDTAVYTTANREVSLREEGFPQALRLVDAILAARQAA